MMFNVLALRETHEINLSKHELCLLGATHLQTSFGTVGHEDAHVWRLRTRTNKWVHVFVFQIPHLQLSLEVFVESCAS